MTCHLTFHRSSDARASRRSHSRAGGISAGCYFKSCQSSVIAPVFQRLEQDVVESSTDEGKHARVISLPRERCTVKRENDEVRTCTSHRSPPPATPPDSMSSPEFFSLDIFARCDSTFIFLSYGNHSIVYIHFSLLFDVLIYVSYNIIASS